MCTQRFAGLSSAIFYVTHGYQGLGAALDANWVFGGGYSHSPAVSRMLTDILALHPPATVTAQLDGLGWSSTALWATGLTGLANDVPWVLTPLVVMALGWLLASSFQSALVAPEPVAVTVFSYTLLTILFMPMNLQIAWSGPLYVGYLVLSGCFLMTRSRR